MAEIDDGEFGWVVQQRSEDSGSPPLLGPAAVRTHDTASGQRGLVFASVAAALLVAVLFSFLFGVGSGGSDSLTDSAAAPAAVSAPERSPNPSGSRQSVGSRRLPPSGAQTPVSPVPEASALSGPEATVSSDTDVTVSSVPEVTVSSVPEVTVFSSATTSSKSSSGGADPSSTVRGSTPTVELSEFTTSQPSPAAAVAGPTPAPAPAPAPKATVVDGRQQAEQSATPTTAERATVQSSLVQSVPVQPAPAATNGISLADGLLTVTGLVTDLDDRGVAGVKVDLFAATNAGKRAKFLAVTATDQQGSYSLAGPLVATGPNANPCAVLVFIAPDGQAFEETGRFRETVICPEEPSAALPHVRLLVSGRPATERPSVSARSVLSAKDKLHLRGTVGSRADGDIMVARYTRALGAGSVLAEYRSVVGGKADIAVATAGQSKSGPERVFIDGLHQRAFQANTSKPTDATNSLLAMLADVVKDNQGLRVEVIVGTAPELAETLTSEVLSARYQSVIKGLVDLGVSAEAVDGRVGTGTTQARRLGGRSVNGQLEFVLHWP